MDVAYTHYLTDRLSIVATLSRFIGGNVIVNEQSSPVYRERRTLSELYAPVFRLSLVYKIGK